MALAARAFGGTSLLMGTGCCGLIFRPSAIIDDDDGTTATFASLVPSGSTITPVAAAAAVTGSMGEGEGVALEFTDTVLSRSTGCSVDCSREANGGEATEEGEMPAVVDVGTAAVDGARLNQVLNRFIAGLVLAADALVTDALLGWPLPEMPSEDEPVAELTDGR